jgi:hypothetical protein
MNNMRICIGLHKSVSFFALLVSVALGFSELEAATPEGTPRKVMLILRGIANSGTPRGQLDDQSALEYANVLVSGVRFSTWLVMRAQTARNFGWPSTVFAATKR